MKTTDKIIWMDINKIIIDPEFEGIFIQKENEIANISENMKVHGFDPAHPIILALSKSHPELNNINADGHTRYKAAIRTGLTKVAVIFKDFADREDLLKFVYEQQLLRRNLTETEIFKSWEALNRLTDKEGKKAKSDTEIAEELKISRRQVAKMKEVVKKAPAEIVEQVKAGELSLNKAYTKLKDGESKPAKKQVLEPVAVPVSVPEEVVSSVDVNDYAEGFIDGLKYALDSLRLHRSLEELQNDASDLRDRKISARELVDKAHALEGAHEQEQAE